MTTITKIIVGLVLSILLMSCQFNSSFGFGVKGNGNVETIERNISNDFNQIKVSRGLDVYITQGDAVNLKVQADENLQDIIITKVENNVLRIYADENINYAASKKVMLTFKNIEKITATSGSDVYATNTITTEDLELNTTSGSDMEITVNANTIDCNSSSGSDLRISGKTEKLFAEASSGSDINAGELMATSGEVRATSGADITVNTSKELYAKASSGGDIKYYGNPEKVSAKDGTSGSIRKQ
jgi:Putative auto-transporter adhesin, head GIN domain